jgi:hypothetical protein
MTGMTGIGLEGPKGPKGMTGIGIKGEQGIKGMTGSKGQKGK